MNDVFLMIRAALEACYTTQSAITTVWHEHDPVAVPCTDEASVENLHSLVLMEHMQNFLLWHVEDKARRTDVADAEIVQCKRDVDRLNQLRNDMIERIDSCLVALMNPALPSAAQRKQNTETVGMAVDRLSILALKVYHMEEQTLRQDVSAEHIATCQKKLNVLLQQRSDLLQAVLDLVGEYQSGQKMPVLYHQFKMYNDAALNPELYKK